MPCTDPIGVFDSGLGGISVLRALRLRLPGEDFLYYGDSRHAPYGDKPLEAVQALCDDAVQWLLHRGVKAVVIACNTATAAAAAQLRARYPYVPIIGTEPALKPAAERHPGGHILVMATERTLHEEKYHLLSQQFETRAGVSNCWESRDAVVLGCTHYPFLRSAIRQIVGPDPEILDGSDGIARQTQRRLALLGLQNPRSDGGSVTLCNSLDDPAMLQRMDQLLNRPL